jgi:hypothetical protein
LLDKARGVQCSDDLTVSDHGAAVARLLEGYREPTDKDTTIVLADFSQTLEEKIEKLKQSVDTEVLSYAARLIASYN